MTATGNFVANDFLQCSSRQKKLTLWGECLEAMCLFNELRRVKGALHCGQTIGTTAIFFREV
jgi:hypothetical protein